VGGALSRENRQGADALRAPYGPACPGVRQQNEAMAKEKNLTVSPFFREFFQLGFYKRSQGRIARQVTFASLLIVILLGAWRLSVFQINAGRGMQFAVPVALGALGIWLAFRLVNIPSFADFLIAVEAEMNKVSWPTRGELVRSSLVVIFCIFFLAAVLFGFDLFWRYLLHVLRIVDVGP
jgi:preprotein translocase subunit SecE